MAYYAAKLVVNGVLTESAARQTVTRIAANAGLSFEQAVAVAHVKYNLRARPGNPKNDADERFAARVMLAKMEQVP